MPATRRQVTERLQHIAELERQSLSAADQAATELAALDRQIRRAGNRLRGTREVAKIAAAATTVHLRARIEHAVRGARAPMSAEDVASLIDADVSRVRDLLALLVDEPCPTRHPEQAPDARLIHNHGTSEAPRWGWVVGDLVDTRTLYGEIEAMLRRRPYTFAELTAATGARRGRISGATVEFARGNLPVWTVGESGRRYRWFIGELTALPAEDRRMAQRVALAPDKGRI